MSPYARQGHGRSIVILAQAAFAMKFAMKLATIAILMATVFSAPLDEENARKSAVTPEGIGKDGGKGSSDTDEEHPYTPEHDLHDAPVVRDEPEMDGNGDGKGGDIVGKGGGHARKGGGNVGGKGSIGDKGGKGTGGGKGDTNGTVRLGMPRSGCAACDRNYRKVSDWANWWDDYWWWESRKRKWRDWEGDGDDDGETQFTVTMWRRVKRVYC